ncbi:MAG: ABC transporter ATP-binding protein [Flavobacteriales bacterium TMED191]|nr:MAG: ABC transporter ATP-binding protein [Flavobacteriales bacterium TMED191]
MISIDNLSLYFGAQNVFENISFMINSSDKIGLVGKNGSGKSTLLRVLTNNLSPNSGKVTHLKNTVVGYLQQDIDFKDQYTLIHEMTQVFGNIENYKKDIDNLNNEIATRTDYNSQSYLDLINKLSRTEELLRMEGGHDVNLQIDKILKGLGFQHEDFDRHTSEFSGGWRMRIELAKILLKNPDVLLLDEPTNHLDIVSIIWLEKWLQNYNGAIILVSHDRQFLDAIINRTIEISFAKINSYKANYSKYLDLRKDRQQKQQQAKKNQDKYIEQTKMLINKFRAKKNKAAFAQTLVKKLSKLDVIEVEQDDVSKMNFRFPPAPHSGKVTFKMKSICKSYGSKEILKNINLEINKGEKIAFVGKNGEGKTTLAKIIVSEIDFEGKTHFGYNVQYGYYAQNQSDFLDDDKTIFQTIDEAITLESNLKVRDVLGSFLFTKDDVDKKIRVLSGGERARVSLCKLLLSPVNFLIMDEPTNHLDIISKDILKKALVDFDGTLIIISHDRSFLQGLSNKIYEFKNKVIKEYLGDMDSFLQDNKLDSLIDLNKDIKTHKKSASKKDSAQKISYHQRKEKDKSIRKLEKKISAIEKTISSLEEKKRKLDVELSNPEKFKELSKNKDFFHNYELSQKAIKEKEMEWGDLVLKLDKLKS